jgi:hypothetical protein
MWRSNASWLHLPATAAYFCPRLQNARRITAFFDRRRQEALILNSGGSAPLIAADQDISVGFQPAIQLVGNGTERSD